MIRDDIKAATITAMKGGDKETTATLRLVSAAIKNRDIEARTGGGAEGRRRAGHRSAPEDGQAAPRDPPTSTARTAARTAPRPRKREIAVIERFLPQQLSDAEAEAKIREIVAETGASSMKDMGRVMALVKERLGASIEPARASGLVKAALS